MIRREKEKIKVTVRLFKEDFDYIKENYDENYNASIRNAVHRWIKNQKRHNKES